MGVLAPRSTQAADSPLSPHRHERKLYIIKRIIKPSIMATLLYKEENETKQDFISQDFKIFRIYFCHKFQSLSKLKAIGG
jgi:hypothetical protein